MDDATGTVPAAILCREEDTSSYLLLVNKLVRQRGLPLAIYSDRHPVFKFTGDTARYPADPTQFARALDELGIRQIFARSPQAKGIVERAARTFQDWLVTEPRLAGAASIDEANEVLEHFIPGFNEKFAVQAQGDCPAYRCLEHSVCLDRILCFKTVARCPGTTPSSTRDAHCSCCLTKLVRPTPECMSRSRRTWMASLWCDIKERLSPRRRLRRIRPS